MRHLGFIFVFIFIIFNVVLAGTNYPSVEFYQGQTEGYYCYRIPDLLVTQSGTLLAFTEARRFDCSDHGWVDLVVKRSSDNGKSWSNLTVVYSASSATVNSTVGNAVPLQDRDTKTIFAPFCLNNKKMVISQSDDDGLTWSAPSDLSAASNASWVWVAAGPPSGIQLLSGRLLFPINHHVTEWTVDGRLSIIYSDDHGKTWQMGATSEGPATPNESQAVEIQPNVVLVNSRSNYDYRYQTFSYDGGLTFENVTIASTLIQPGPGGCEGSIFHNPVTGVLLYSGPSNATERVNMTVFASTDGAQTWSLKAIVDPGFAAYSALAALSDGTTLLAYETNNYQSVTLVYL